MSELACGEHRARRFAAALKGAQSRPGDGGVARRWPRPVPEKEPKSRSRRRTTLLANLASPVPNRKWGPALLPAPTAPSEGSAGVRQPGQKPEGPDPLSILAHQLRRRFLSHSSLVRGANRPTRLRGPRVRWSFDPSGLLLNLDPKTEIRGENRPMFHGPSWVDHSCVPLCSPQIPRRRQSGNRVALEGRSTLPAPLTGWPRKEPESSSHCLPAEIGPLVTCRTVLPLPAFRRGRDRRPDHLSTMHASPESQKRKMG